MVLLPTNSRCIFILASIAGYAKNLHTQFFLRWRSARKILDAKTTNNWINLKEVRSEFSSKRNKSGTRNKMSTCSSFNSFQTKDHKHHQSLRIHYVYLAKYLAVMWRYAALRACSTTGQQLPFWVCIYFLTQVSWRPTYFTRSPIAWNHSRSSVRLHENSSAPSNYLAFTGHRLVWRGRSITVFCYV